MDAIWIAVAVAGILGILLMVTIAAWTAHRYWQRQALERRQASRHVSDCNSIHTVATMCLSRVSYRA